jgi:hypothetical protein
MRIAQILAPTVKLQVTFMPRTKLVWQNSPIDLGEVTIFTISRGRAPSNYMIYCLLLITF